MKIYLGKRCIIRIITFSIAIIATIIAFIIINSVNTKQLKTALENNYLESIELLSSSTDNINNTLSKGIYAGSPEMLAELSSKLWHDCALAKSALSHIPMGETQLDKTNKFLSQVGNYSISIAQTAQRGNSLSQNEYNNLMELSDFSDELKKEIWELEQKIQSGQVKLKEVFDDIKGVNTITSPAITEGFSSMEEGFENYPTLIYDGPFSDHIMQKQPEMLKNKVGIDKDKALLIASQKTDIPIDKLFFSDEEKSTMPSYRFEGSLEKENLCVSITKQGGYLSYFLKSRNISRQSLTPDDAIKSANSFLEHLGLTDMKNTYYEIYNNICTINYATVQGGKTIYTDLIKVSVALDTGEIVGYDARGYLVNHKDRQSVSPLRTKEEAQNILSPYLTVKSSNIAIIPTKGQNEVTCYEFACKTPKNQDVLVYVNVLDLKEEQILLLYKSKDGILTM